MATLPLQPILGTCKDDPAFCVLTGEESPEELHVYFGLALIEKVNNPGGFAYKGLLGRLYNIGFKRSRLVAAFGHPVSTLSRWGEAVKSGDIDQMARAFSGQGAPLRLKPEIERFVRAEFRRIFPDDPYTYSIRVLDRIREIFNEKFSSETLRPIFNSEKAALGLGVEVSAPGEFCPGLEGVSAGNGAEDNFPWVDVQSLEADGAPVATPVDLPGNSWTTLGGNQPPENQASASPESGAEPTHENQAAASSESNLEQPVHLPAKATTCDSGIVLNSDIGNNRKYSLSFLDAGGAMAERFSVNHLGLAIFLPIILGMDLPERLWNQWISSILLGAVNLEQTGRLDFRSLEFLLRQPTISSIFHQQTALGRISDSDSALRSLQANAELVGASESEYFYYDPHGMPYTGMRNILKGWCGAIGKVAKVNYQDFIHTDRGDPVHIGIYDNFLDLRERFADNVDVFIKEVLKGRRDPAVFVVDR